MVRVKCVIDNRKSLNKKLTYKNPRDSAFPNCNYYCFTGQKEAPRGMGRTTQTSTSILEVEKKLSWVVLARKSSMSNWHTDTVIESHMQLQSMDCHRVFLSLSQPGIMGNHTTVIWTLVW